ncbi:RNA polymerase sigma factor [Limnoglobus roseus]|uniref:Sigma-70 family RNA polymerase sigma factor n=1 Tax=Limnoglobus roseus TaxID=2598579 RepID=A0A5C1ACX9_9BACT|nr:RNA polymerase sigma factor [Limnoglobus roseus]QEL14908.1 sigma-70 family RNA polymerase sigma factor [Limnoglobus roseus]
MPTAGLRNVVDRLRHAATRRAAAGLSCGDLLEQFVTRRDEGAFAELVRRHGPRVFAVCRRVLGHHQLAEDAYQAVFVVLARKAHVIQPRSAVGGFLYGVARKAALEAFAVSRRRKETLAARVPETQAVACTTVDSDVLAMLDEEIANLSDAYRAAVVLCELDGVGRADAARELGIAEGTLSSRLAAARKQLAARLTKRGVTFSASLFAAVAESAHAAPPPVELAAILPPTVSAIVTGVMRTMIFAKLKTAATLGVLLTVFAAWSFVPSTAPNAAAAPLPKEPADEGLLWTFDKKAAVLIAYTPDGKVEKKLTLKDGKHFLGFTPDGTKVLFAGKHGESAADDATDLTLHQRSVWEDTAGTDLGVPYQPGDQFILSPDDKKVVRTRIAELEIIDDQRYHIFENRLFDVEAKTDEKIDVPKDYQIMQWAADGKSWRAIQNNIGRDPKLPNYRWVTVPVAGGKPTPINDGYSLMWLTPSRDDKAFLAAGWEHPFRKTGFKWFNVSPTGKFQEVAEYEKTAFLVMRWSPDGKRVAAARYEYDPDTGKLHDATLFTAKPGGTDVQKVARFEDDNQNTTFLGWFPTKPAAKK